MKSVRRVAVGQQFGQPGRAVNAPNWRVRSCLRLSASTRSTLPAALGQGHGQVAGRAGLALLGVGAGDQERLNSRAPPAKRTQPRMPRISSATQRARPCCITCRRSECVRVPSTVQPDVCADILLTADGRCPGNRR